MTKKPPIVVRKKSRRIKNAVVFEPETKVEIVKSEWDYRPKYSVKPKRKKSPLIDYNDSWRV